MGVLTHCACPAPDPPVGDYCRKCNRLVDKSSPRQKNGVRIDPAELKRELAMLRRQFNQRVDLLERLIDRHTD